MICRKSTPHFFSLSRMSVPPRKVSCVSPIWVFCFYVCKYFIFAKDFISRLYALVWELITVWSCANDGLLFLARGSVLTRCTCYMTCSTVFGCHDSLVFSLTKLLQKNAKHLMIKSWKRAKYQINMTASIILTATPCLHWKRPAAWGCLHWKLEAMHQSKHTICGKSNSILKLTLHGLF